MRTSAQAMRQKRIVRTIAASGAVVAALLSLLPMMGCGGGSKSNNSSAAAQSRGGLTFTVTWPNKSKTRVIPLATSSIRITLNRIIPGPTVQPIPNNPRLLVGPDIPPDDESTPRTSTATFNALELGTYEIRVIAYPNANGTGTPLATATVTQAVVGGINSPLNITLDATVAAAEITPATGPNLRVDSTRQFTVTFRDAGGAIVPVDPAAVTWTTETPSVVTINSSGLATMVGIGQGTIRATYKEPFTASGAEGTGDTATALVNVVDVGLSNTQSPKFRADLQNTGRVTGGASTSGVQAWAAQITGPVVFSSPVVGPDNVSYIGAYDRNLYAFNPDGTLKWVFRTDGEIEAAPVLGRDGTVYIGTLNGTMYALRQKGNTQEGELIWTAPVTVDGPIFGSATISDKNSDTRRDGYLYFGSTDTGRTLYRRDALNGAAAGSFTASAGIQTCPAFSVDGSVVYFGTVDGKLYAVNSVTMQQVWVVDTGSNNTFFSSSPAVDPATGNIYIGGLDGNLYGFDPRGVALAGFPIVTGIPIYSSPAIAPDSTVYFGTFDNVTGTDLNDLYAIDGLSGATKWTFRVPLDLGTVSGITSSPAIGADGVIYFGSYNGNVYALNPDGTQKWKFSTQENIDSSPGIGPDGTVYIGQYGGSAPVRFFAIR